MPISRLHGGGDGGGNSTTIDDLDDNILTQILFRLSSGGPTPCAPLVACKLVNKRWFCLISDPKFASHFSNNHKKKISIFSESGSNTEDDEPAWTFIASRRVGTKQYSVFNSSSIESVFGSPKLSLGFLPYAFVIEATFKDLVLCSDQVSHDETRYGCDRNYYITNPLTKQWVALPPCPAIFNRWAIDNWVGLVCQEPYDYTQDYKFRVVLIYQNMRLTPVHILLVYCSEIGEWKKFNLTVSIKHERPAADDNRLVYNTRFQAVICNGVIYLYHEFYFASFNPFDVDETTETTTIEAKVLPSLPDPVDGFLCESSGQLFIMHHPNKEYRTIMRYKKHGNDIEFPLKVWKLDPNQVPLIWETTFDGSCTTNVNIVPSFDINPCDNTLFSNLGMHPNNEKLIYMHLSVEEEFVLCDTQTRLIKPLKSPTQSFLHMIFHRLELQWWPTSVPKAYVSNASQ